MKKKLIPTYIKTFCKENFKESPIFVPIKVESGTPMNECFPAVEAHIEKFGGIPIFGWCIHVWKKVMVEAEFHCVWESPKMKLYDITPKAENGLYIVFIPDPEKSYEGRQVNNIRKPLSSDPDIRLFIELFNEYFLLNNEGDLAEKHGEIKLDREKMIQLASKLIPVENRLKSKYGNQRKLY